jgi:hypothetical protein
MPTYSEEYSPKRLMTEAEHINQLADFISETPERMLAYRAEAQALGFDGETPVFALIAHASRWIAERWITESHTLTVRAPYFQEQLEAVKADSPPPSDQPLPVAAPKRIHAHWSNVAATTSAAPASLSLPRAWELRK